MVGGAGLGPELELASVAVPREHAEGSAGMAEGMAEAHCAHGMGRLHKAVAARHGPAAHWLPPPMHSYRGCTSAPSSHPPSTHVPALHATWPVAHFSATRTVRTTEGGVDAMPALFFTCVHSPNTARHQAHVGAL